MRIIRNVPLDSKVLTVAVIGEKDDWTAYIGAVEGIDHDIEQHEVARNGSKLPFEIAKRIYPQLALQYKWRV